MDSRLFFFYKFIHSVYSGAQAVCVNWVLVMSAYHNGKNIIYMDWYVDDDDDCIDVGFRGGSDRSGGYRQKTTKILSLAKQTTPKEKNWIIQMINKIIIIHKYPMFSNQDLSRL